MDPATIVAAISAALAFFKNIQESEWETEIAEQLATLASDLEQIYAYLQQFPQIIGAALDDAQRKQWQATMQAYVLNVNNFIQANPAGPADAATTQQWENQFAQLKTLIEQVDDYQDYGFIQFAVVALGTSSAAGLIAYLKDDAGLFSLLVKSVLSYYQAAVDPAVPNSFASALSARSNAQNQVVAQFNPWFNRFWCTGISSEPEGPRPGLIRLYNVAGSVQTGVGAVTYNNVVGSYDFMPGTSGDTAQAQGIAILNGGVGQYNAATQSLASVQACIGCCQKIIQQLQAVGENTSTIQQSDLYIVVQGSSSTAQYSVIPFVQHEILPGIEVKVFGPDTQEACNKYVSDHIG